MDSLLLPTGTYEYVRTTRAFIRLSVCVFAQVERLNDGGMNICPVVVSFIIHPAPDGEKWVVISRDANTRVKALSCRSVA